MNEWIPVAEVRGPILSHQVPFVFLCWLNVMLGWGRRFVCRWRRCSVIHHCSPWKRLWSGISSRRTNNDVFWVISRRGFEGNAFTHGRVYFVYLWFLKLVAFNWSNLGPKTNRDVKINQQINSKYRKVFDVGSSSFHRKKLRPWVLDLWRWNVFLEFELWFSGLHVVTCE